MAGKRIIIAGCHPMLDINGNPVAGGRIEFYVNETTELATVYTTADLTVPLTNPVVADASGSFPSIFADEASIFSVTITDANMRPVGTLRNRDGVQSQLYIGEDLIFAYDAAVEGKLDKGYKPDPDLLAAISAKAQVAIGIAADQAPAIEDRLDVRAAAGGPIELGGGKITINSDVAVPASTTLIGIHGTLGEESEFRDSARRATVLMQSPLAMVRLGNMAAIENVVQLNSDIRFPRLVNGQSDMNQIEMLGEISRFSGTGIKIEGDDARVRSVLSIGFRRGVVSCGYNVIPNHLAYGPSRPRIEDYWFDNTNGLDISNSYDIPWIDLCHGWNFYNGHTAVPGFTQSAVLTLADRAFYDNYGGGWGVYVAETGLVYYRQGAAGFWTAGTPVGFTDAMGVGAGPRAAYDGQPERFSYFNTITQKASYRCVWDGGDIPDGNIGTLAFRAVFDGGDINVRYFATDTLRLYRRIPNPASTHPELYPIWDAGTVLADGSGLLADKPNFNDQPEGYRYYATDERAIYTRRTWSEGMPLASLGQRNGTGFYLHDRTDGARVNRVFTYGWKIGEHYHNIYGVCVSGSGNDSDLASAIEGSVGTLTTGTINGLFLWNAIAGSHDINVYFKHTRGAATFTFLGSEQARTAQVIYGTGANVSGAQMQIGGSADRRCKFEAGCGVVSIVQPSMSGFPEPGDYNYYQFDDPTDIRRVQIGMPLHIDTTANGELYSANYRGYSHPPARVLDNLGSRIKALRVGAGDANQLAMEGASAGMPPRAYVEGTDANVGVVVSAKGGEQDTSSVVFSRRTATGEQFLAAFDATTDIAPAFLRGRGFSPGEYRLFLESSEVNAFWNIFPKGAGFIGVTRPMFTGAVGEVNEPLTPGQWTGRMTGNTTFELRGMNALNQVVSFVLNGTV